jgi:hypothetical protein
MAGELTGFNPDTFRSVITATMVMGLPQKPEEQPTFYFRTIVTYPVGTKLDTEGRPIDPRIKPSVTTALPPIQVPCAVEFAPDTTNDEGLAGTYWQTRAVLTLLDTQYEQVKDAIEVQLGDRRYIISFLYPPLGLGLVTVYQLSCFAKGTGE